MQESLDQITHAIQAILAPAVMVTTCALLISGIQQRYVAMGDRLRTMNSERMTLLRTLSAAPADPLARLRLIEIATQAPRILRRHKLVRNATVLLYLAIFFYIMTMFILAGADIVASVYTASLALLGFLLGTTIVLGGIVVIAVEVYASHREIAYEVQHGKQLAASEWPGADAQAEQNNDE